MGNTDYIENYFKGVNSDLQKKQFEKKILEDASFAQEVAFYLSADGVIKQQLQEEKKQRFREIYNQQKVVSIRPRVKNLWRYMAAASVTIAVIALLWLFSINKTSPGQLADKYIQQNFKTLPVKMGKQDSLQKGLDLLNSNKLTDALAMFETLVQNDVDNSEAKKYAGITSLRLENFDKSLKYFTMLETDSSFSNPGKFYKAITFLKRNKTGDKEAAKSLLQQVIENDLEGKNEAIKWLKELE